MSKGRKKQHYNGISKKIVTVVIAEESFYVLLKSNEFDDYNIAGFLIIFTYIKSFLTINLDIARKFLMIIENCKLIKRYQYFENSRTPYVSRFQKSYTFNQISERKKNSPIMI